MKIFPIILCLFFCLFAKAETIAVHFNNTKNQKACLERCKSENLPIVFLDQENTLLVDGVTKADLENFGFVSTVRSKGNQLVFNTSTIMVKMRNEHKPELPAHLNNFNLSAHTFIPKLFYVECIVSNEYELNEFLSALQMNEFVQTAEIKQVFTIQSSSNDPLFANQWSIANNGTPIQSNGTIDADMNVDSAWTISEGSPTIKIAILDSGVDTLHEDLVNNMLSGYDGFTTDSTDTKGYPTPNFNSDGHGTACAGIAAAQSNNNLGVAGIAPMCKIIPIRIFYYQDYGGSIGVQATTNTDALLSGSAYAWRIGEADIMSTSAGLNPLFIGVLGINTQLVSDEITEAYVQGRNGYGVPMFFSAGNDDFDDVLWPGDLETTIAVGASTMCDERKNPSDCSPENWGSSYGLSLDVVAPGVRITTTDMTGFNGYSNNGYTYTFNGTSAACPNAAGVGALILSYSPGLHARDVKAVLNLTADRVGGYAYDSIGMYGTWNEEMGHGRVNAFAALKLAETFASSVAINELNSTSFVKLYPNPSEGLLYFENNADKNLMVSVYNTLGAITHQLNLKQGVNKVQLDLSAGLYFIRDEKGLLIDKLLVN